MTDSHRHLGLTDLSTLHTFAYIYTSYIHGKNDFAEAFKILLDTDLKIILLDPRNNFVGTLKIMSKKC